MMIDVAAAATRGMGGGGSVVAVKGRVGIRQTPILLYPHVTLRTCTYMYIQYILKRVTYLLVLYCTCIGDR